MKLSALSPLIIILSALCWSCSKKTDDSRSLPAPTIINFPKTDTINGIITIKGTNFSKTPGNNIVSFNSVQSVATTELDTSYGSYITVKVPFGATSGPLRLTVLSKSFTTTDSFFVAKNSWAEKKDFPGQARQDAIGFSVDNMGYVGLGISYPPGNIFTPNNYYNDLWQYNPSSDSWTQKASFPGQAVDKAFSIVINGIVYIGAGRSPMGYDTNVIYEYDPQADKWSIFEQYAPYGGVSNSVTGFAYNSNIYVFDGSGINKDEIDTHQWTLLTAFPGSAGDYRRGYFYFIIGNKLYIGGGENSNAESINDLWVYDLDLNTWTKKTSSPFDTSISPVNFEINNVGYVGFGSLNEGGFEAFESYNPSTDTWKPLFSFNNHSSLNGWGTSLVVNGKAFIVTGYGTVNKPSVYSFYDLTTNWEFTP